MYSERTARRTRRPCRHSRAAAGAFSVNGWGFLPYGYASASYTPNRRFSTELNVSVVTTGDNWMLETGLFLKYWLGDNWDLTVGYQYYGRDVNVSELANLVDYNVSCIAISYSW